MHSERVREKYSMCTVAGKGFAVLFYDLIQNNARLNFDIWNGFRMYVGDMQHMVSLLK
jgi:hypothetical protein